MNTDWLVGIDDTDDAESIGTGRLARLLAEALEGRGLLRETHVTRHQFLVHPDIPYTSHNSSACIAGRDAGAGVDALADAARDFLLENFRPTANPGLCVVAPGSIPATWVALGRRAQREVLALDEADRTLLGGAGLVWWKGETGQGRIGAACGTALRSTGDDGRFIALRGIRELRGVLRAGEIRARSAVARVETDSGVPLDDAVEIDTQDWVRPTLRGGEPVLRVRPEDGRWVPAETRKRETP